MFASQVRLMKIAGLTPAVLAPVVFCGLALSAVWFVAAYYTAHIFAAAVANPQTVLREVAPALLIVAAMVVVRPVIVLLREIAVNRLGVAFKTRLRAAALEHLDRIGPVGMGSARIGHVQSALTDGVENLEPFYGRYLPQIVVTTVVALVLGGYLTTIDPVVGCSLGVSALAAVFLPRLWDKILSRRGADHWAAFENLNAEFIDSMTGVTVLKANNAAQKRQAYLDSAAQTLLVKTMGQLKLSLVESGLTSFIQFAGPVIATLIAVSRGLGPAELFLVLLVSLEMFRPFKELSGYWHQGYLGTFAVSSLLDILTLPNPRSPLEPAANTAGADASAPAGELILDAVTYLHAQKNQPTDADSQHARHGIREVSLHLHPGEWVALVGPSGAGKSTLIDVLSGLITPQSGQVHSNPDDVWAVSQNPVFFGETVREYLQYGSTAKVPGDRELERVLATVNLNLDLDRELGENAANISGGQRQRLALARVLMAKPRILILDETTSALDGNTESRALAGIRAQLPDTCLLMVNHRLSSTLSCDRVLVMETGRIVEDGTPEELMAAGGLYAHLAQGVRA